MKWPRLQSLLANYLVEDAQELDNRFHDAGPDRPSNRLEVRLTRRRRSARTNSTDHLANSSTEKYIASDSKYLLSNLNESY
jgi:hypothetical protein